MAESDFPEEEPVHPAPYGGDAQGEPAQGGLPEGERQRLVAEGRSLWDAKAEFWDNLHGETGNKFHSELVGPAVERLLALQPGERVLDVACGSGVVARRLASLGGEVTAVDASPALLARARARQSQGGSPIRYAAVDATDEEALAALGEGAFDAVVCTMALMDMPAIAPLYRAVRRLLPATGRFVFVTSHPAFNSNGPTFVSEQVDVDGQLYIHHCLQIREYRSEFVSKVVGAIGEPGPHYMYHRPLHVLLGEAFAAGLVLDGLEEPGFAVAEDETPAPFSWDSVAEAPPVLATRLRPAVR